MQSRNDFWPQKMQVRSEYNSPSNIKEKMQIPEIIFLEQIG